MRILITNDDGIDAEGLAQLVGLASCYADDIWVVAPDGERSEIGHRVTTREPIRIEERGSQRYAISGTPADCTRVGLAHLMPERPDWVWAGINHGGNLGRHDFVISGTMAAAREAAMAGVPSVAFSHFLNGTDAINWERAREWARRGWESVREEAIAFGEFWAINLPHPSMSDGTRREGEPVAVRCHQEAEPLPVVYDRVEDGAIHYVGDYTQRPRSAGSDVEVCFSGNIAVSRVSI